MQKENTLTVEQWCGQWFTANRHKWNGNTEGGYRNLIYSHILPGIGGVVLPDLTEQTVTGFYDVLQSEPGTQCQKCVVRPSASAAVHERSSTGTVYSVQPGAALPGTRGRGIQNSPFAPGPAPALPERSGAARRAPSHLHRTIKRPAAM